jgi:lysozyme
MASAPRKYLGAFFLTPGGAVLHLRQMSNFVYSKSGVTLTEGFEALRLTAYKDIRGRWTIGYGHTGPEVHEGLVWTETQAENALANDILWASRVVNRLVVYPITQNEFDALVDFTYNVGAGDFASSTMLKDLNKGDIKNAALQFDLWDHAGGQVVAGLLRRRETELAEFSS